MATEGDKLTRKQEQALAALLECPTITSAAEQVGVSERTLRRWLDEPDFLREFRTLRRQIVEGVVTRLQQSAGQAVDTLVRNLTCGIHPVEVRAATEILQQAVQGVTVADVLDRLDALEAANKPRLQRGTR